MYFIAIAILIAYLAVAVAIAVFQRHLMYHPDKRIGPPETYGLEDVRDIRLTSKDGTALQAWVHEAREHYPTIVYFHGNSGHIGDRSAKLRAFVENGFGFVAVSYRGFGKSAGHPGEQGIYDDAAAAIDYAVEQLHIPAHKLIYFGESLGSGVAVHMARERSPALLVLEAAYTSVETRSAEMFPYILFVRMLVRDKYDSFAKIRHVRAPLLMLHGEVDATIPVRHGRALFQAAPEPKSLLVYPNVNHTDYTNDQIITPLLNTARQYKLL